MSVFAAFLYFKLAVTPVIRSIAGDAVRVKAVIAINDAVEKAVSDTPSYVDMVSVTYDSDNNVSSIRVRSSVVNSIVRKTTSLALSGLADMGEAGVSIPVGSLSGIMFLSGKGPAVEVKAIPVGTIDAQVRSEFTEAGINQTFHRIYIRLDARINLILPGANEVLYAAADVPILDNVIVGKVPQTYLNSTSTQDMMDLIP